jgi:DNA/RNA-binding domain of Phe-tRNA-synthetase-like protein
LLILLIQFQPTGNPAPAQLAARRVAGPCRLWPWTGGRITVLSMKTRLSCPCGTLIQGSDEDDLVEKAQAHLAEKHQGREYDRDAILFMAY